MLKPLLDVALPCLAILLMVVAGTGLTAADFGRVGQRPLLAADAVLRCCHRLPQSAR